MSAKKIIFTIACTFALLPDVAQANTMTEDAIRSFIQQTVDVMNQSASRSVGELHNYFDQHLAKNSQFGSQVYYEIPGQPPQENQLVLDKEGYIENVLKSRESITNFSNAVTVDAITIDPEGRTASISTRSTETGRMSMGPIGDASMEGKSKCDQRLALSEDNVIQVVQASCQTIIRFGQ